MNARQTSLFIGRFQPFHLGHQDAIRQIIADGKTTSLLVAIGSAEQSYLPDNPFTAGERFRMIHAALQSMRLTESGVESFILPIRNIDNYALWPHHVQKMLPPFARIYSGSPTVRELFRSMTDVQVCPLNDRKRISATAVRQLLALGGMDWQELVPPEVGRLIEEIGGAERISAVSRTNFDTE